METLGLSVLLVARPGRLRDGQETIARTVSRIQHLDRANDGASALKMIAECVPSLVLLDADMPGDEAWTALRRIKAGWVMIPCIVLADSRSQREAAYAGGANAVLAQGFTTRNLTEAVDRLAHEHG